MCSRLRTITLLIALLWGLVAKAQDRQVLHGHRPAVVAQLSPLKDLPRETSMSLAIGLPLRNRAELEQLLQQLYDPSSTNFHRYLSSAQFTERFGATVQDYEKVAAYVERQGLKVTGRHGGRLLLDVSGSAADIERVFQVKMKVFQHPTEARTFFAPDAEPSVETGIPLMEVKGLDNYITPHPMNLKHRPIDLIQAKPNAGSGSGGTYIGNDFRAAYAPNVSLDGTGQSVGLFELEGYYPQDIATYESRAGLPSVTLTNVLVDGYNGVPDSDVDAIGEVSLDIEMAISMAPKLSKVLVYEASTVNLTLTVINDVLTQMADDNLASQLSSSWSWGGGTNATGDQAFLKMAAQGQSFYEASGDSGEYHTTIPEPSDDAYVTVVGGTTLTTTGAGGAWSSETTWNWFPGQPDASSGGVSTLYFIPTWQQGISMSSSHGSMTMRNIPDVALTADNVYVVYDNGLAGEFGGTSCAAPLWAGFTALVNQHGAAHGQAPVGFINPAIYAIGKGSSYTTDFHDVTTGNNTNASSRTRFFAVTGYDLCTGWGTPNGSNMITALLPGLTQVAPTVNWNAPSGIVYGTTLNGTQLNATANVPGTFTYSPVSGTVLNAGTYTLSVVFTPTDAFDYTAVTNTVSLTVSPATLTVTATSFTKVFGQNNPTLTVNYNGYVTGDNSGVLTGSPSLSTTATTTSSVAGSPYTITVGNGTLSASNYVFNFINGLLAIVPDSTAGVVGTSANPVLVGSDVTFSATLTAAAPGSGTPTGSVQFIADGGALGTPVSLSGGVASADTATLTAGSHVISFEYAGDGNFKGLTNSLTPNESINTPPIAADIVLNRTIGSGAKISVAALLAASANANSGTLSLISTDSASTNGGTVTMANGWVFYSPQPGFTNVDRFSYVIGDSEGAQSTGTVSSVVPADNSQSQNIVSVQDLGNNASAIQFFGIPGRTYSIQYTQTLQTPSWQTVGTVTAGATGAYGFTNTPPDGSPAGFYRSTNP